MKKLFITASILICVCILHNCLQAQPAKVFSKYNYYTSEKDVQIYAELQGINAGSFNLSVFKDGNQIAKSSSYENNLLNVSVSLLSFQFGKNILQFTIDSKDSIVQQGKVEVTRLHPKLNEVKIDLQTGGLIADGAPFFPFGFYCKPVGNLPEQEITHGFNMIGPYQSNLPDTYEERRSYMDRCAQVGMKVQYSVNSLIGSGHNGAKGLEMSEENKMELLKKEIIAFRDHPALLSWYINDEPDGQSRPPALLEKAYNIVHELDPYHPVSIVFMLPPQFKRFRNTMDIAMTDPYPVPGPLDIVEQFVKQMNTDFTHEKSIWLVPQAFGGQEMWAREPTAKEIRLMTYTGLVNGVKGIQYYTHSSGNLNPQAVSAWSVCSDMAVEVNQMSKYLLSADISPAATSPDPGIIVRSFSYNGDLLIIAANKENTPRFFSIKIIGRINNTYEASALLWFENREVAFSNNALNDIIDASGTRVYLIKRKYVKDSTIFYRGNLTLNPGFEKIISPGLPIGSNTKKSFPSKAKPGSSFFVDPSQSVEGMFSLRLITPSDSTGDKIRLLPIVIKAKNSYNVSIWAKAKAHERMPSFRISVEGPGKEQIFKLTNSWERYSFIFRSDSSFTSAIVSLELITAGTAWFDMIQVTPDPLISYAITGSNTAMVSVATTEADAVIKYSMDGAAGEMRSVFSQPILIDKPTTFHAGLFIQDNKIADAVLFVPVNNALGKPVTLQSEYAPQYASSGPSSLTDGLMGSTAFKDVKWLGFSGRDFVATIDMQEKIPLRSVAVNFLSDPNSGIYLPPEILIFISDNGKDFQPAGSKVYKETPKQGEPFLQTFSISLNKIKARYIRVVAKDFGEIPDGYLFKGTKPWIFVDEVMVE